MNQEQKLFLYRKGLYKFPVPGTCTAFWTAGDWIRFIDANGHWMPDTKVVTVEFKGRLDTERCEMYQTKTHLQLLDFGKPSTQAELRAELASGNVHGFAYQVSKSCTITTDEGN